MENVKSILLAGVGGQGTILVSKLLTQGLVQAGYDVKMSEVHGMAQRGGSVSTQVRYGKQVYSPIIGRGQADILVSFEKMEALRYSPFLKPQGIAIVNEHEILPITVASGQVDYPSGTLEAMGAAFRTIPVDGAGIARRIGNPRVMNMVLMGALVSAFEMDFINWEELLRQSLPPSLLEVNLLALAAGRSLHTGAAAS